MAKEILTTEELKRALAEAWRADAPHVERLTASAAVLIYALEQAGMRATLVGGGAIEYHSPGSYATTDIDLVVEGWPRETIGRVLVSLGFKPHNRHWILDDLFVEAPGSSLERRVVETVPLGPFELRVLKKEHVLADRIVGFRRWKTWAYGIQAIDMLEAFGDDLDEEFLRVWLRKEGSEDAFDLLREIAASDVSITTQELDRQWHQRYR
jgi:hypothetical protein